MKVDILLMEAMAGLQRNYKISQSRKQIVAWGPRCSAAPMPGIRVVRACDEVDRQYLKDEWRWIGLYDYKTVTLAELREDIEHWWHENWETARAE